MTATARITLRRWAENDVDILRQCNTPEMMKYLGGPESDEQVATRHARYLRLNQAGTAHMFALSTVAERHKVGAIGYWEGTFEERPVHECGWSIVSGAQGKGLAREALVLLLAERASIGANLPLYAFPSIENEGSNALCRTAGFRVERPIDLEFPLGHTMHCNVWTIDAASNP